MVKTEGHSGPNIIDKQHGGVSDEGSGPQGSSMSLLRGLRGRERRFYGVRLSLVLGELAWERKGVGSLSGRGMWDSEEEGHIHLMCTPLYGWGMGHPIAL